MKRRRAKSPPKFFKALKTNKSLRQTVIVIAVMVAFISLLIVGAATSHDSDVKPKAQGTKLEQTSRRETTDSETEVTTEEVTTEEPVTDPPVTEPPETDPPVTLPLETELPATAPPVTQPPVTSPPATDPPATQPPEDPENQMTVYVTPTGKKYHYENPCGNGKYSPSTLDKALKRGLKPCEKCVMH